MPAQISHPKDFWTGVMFLCFGLAAVVLGQDYDMGTARRMGPSYFPIVLGGLLALIGVAGIVRSFIRKGDSIGKLHFKEIVLVLASVLLFGFLMRGAGLVPATLVLVLLSAWASPRFRPVPALLLAIGLSAFAVVLFVKVLGLPMPAFGPWLGFR